MRIRGKAGTAELQGTLEGLLNDSEILARPISLSEYSLLPVGKERLIRNTSPMRL